MSYDIIGDVHGQYGKLTALLANWVTGSRMAPIVTRKDVRPCFSAT